MSVAVRTSQLTHISKSDLTENKGANTTRNLWSRIVERFTDQIGEIDTLAEEIARAGGLRRSDSHTLRKDSHEVRESTSVPEQFSIAEILRIEDTVFALTLHFKAINYLQFITRVASILHVSLDCVVSLGTTLEMLNLTLQFIIIHVNWVLHLLC